MKKKIFQDVHQEANQCDKNDSKAIDRNNTELTKNNGQITGLLLFTCNLLCTHQYSTSHWSFVVLHILCEMNQKLDFFFIFIFHQAGRTFWLCTFDHDLVY